VEHFSHNVSGGTQQSDMEKIAKDVYKFYFLRASYALGTPGHNLHGYACNLD
jgi:hypothetical protein